MQSTKLFAYGLLKSGSDFFNEHLKDKAVIVKKGYVLGELYMLPEGYHALCEGTDRIEGEFMIFKDSSVLRLTDEFEDYDEFFPDKSMYIRKDTMVYFNDKTRDHAWIYVMRKDKITVLKGKRLIKD